MSKRVLITGASGFVGSNVLQYLLNNTDWTFVAIVSFRHRGNPKNVPLSDRVEVFTHDLTGEIPDIGKFDYVLHIASQSHVDRSIKDPVNFVENNISATLQTLEYARKHPVEKFIMFSTDEVYGANEHHDWDILLPTNPYSASKGAEELLSISYYHSYQVPVIITNGNNIVGPNQDAEKFVPKIIEQIKRGETVTIHTNKGAHGRRVYNPVDNVGSALRWILIYAQATLGADRPQRYSLTGGQEMTNLAMAKLVAEILGLKLKYKKRDVRSIRPTYDAFYSESEDDWLADLGWEAPLTLKQGLRWIK